LRSANKSSGPPEPDPFSDEEFHAWRAFLRVHAYVTDELDRRMGEEHALRLTRYGTLITLVSAPEMRLPMGELGARRLVSPSKISRVVDDLERKGLVKRTPAPADRRSFFATITRKGLQKLREAQVTHHAVVRERFLGPLSEHQVRQLTQIWDTALPGVVDAEVWPPPQRRQTPRR
jgi:DNA-binding MarR family transcriptional regulator